MLSKKTQDTLELIKNIYKIVQEENENGYSGTMKELIIAAIKKTAKDDQKGYSTVASSITRGLEITGDGSMEKVRQMIEDACTGKEFNHNCDDLLIYLIDSKNQNDDNNEEIRNAYLAIFEN